MATQIKSWSRLMEIWDLYHKAIKAKPYDADKVQSYGLAFAYYWHHKDNKLLISILTGIAQDDLTYDKKREVMLSVRDNLDTLKMLTDLRF